MWWLRATPVQRCWMGKRSTHNGSSAVLRLLPTKTSGGRAVLHCHLRNRTRSEQRRVPSSDEGSDGDRKVRQTPFQHPVTEPYRLQARRCECAHRLTGEDTVGAAAVGDDCGVCWQ
jgi:hypothetical protein